MQECCVPVILEHLRHSGHSVRVRVRVRVRARACARACACGGCRHSKFDFEVLFGVCVMQSSNLPAAQAHLQSAPKHDRHINGPRLSTAYCFLPLGCHHSLALLIIWVQVLRLRLRPLSQDELLLPRIELNFICVWELLSGMHAVWGVSFADSLC